ncbi:MAG: AMP-binding protein [Clostridia bacterium]|nr:AMP-binding protein [Clostridia bacterium]
MKLNKFEKFTDLKDMLNKSAEKFADRPAYVFKTETPGKFKNILYRELKQDVDALGTSLINIGLKGKRVAVISENRYEWGIAYLAISCGTGVVVPLDKALPANELECLIIRSQVEAIFYSKKYDEIMMDIKSRNTTDLRYYISMDLEERKEGVLSQKELIQKGKKLLEEGDRRFLDATIDAEKMGIMLFTSGTTAKSKAVMLSHKNICANLMDIAAVIKLTEEDRLLSFLPLHHTFECTVGFLYPISKGCSIAFCGGVRHLSSDISDYKITAMISVPALYEVMYKRLIKEIEKKGKKELLDKGTKISGVLMKFGVDMRKKIFSEIHEKFGGKLRLFVNGGAALDKEVEKGFNDLGIVTVQGYGLTETSPVISAGNDFYRRVGSIGKVFPSLKVKIVNKDRDGIGEIIVKGPSVMLGYYNNEEATKEVLKDGWFYTGDLGYFDKDNFLFISGRSKNVIVLKNGKNIFPEEMETLLCRIEGVKEAMVYGKPEEKDDDVKICAKIVYDKDIMKETYNLENEEEIKELLWEKVKEINKTMPAYKYIKEIIITTEELIKTTTQKVKRHEELKKILG